MHLEGDPLAAAGRVKQLHKALKQLQSDHSHQGLIVCGDFNCQLQASACTSWLALGRVLPGAWG